MSSDLVQLVLAGLSTGSIYGLIALGFNVIFKATDAINFAQGEWVMMGGMIAAVLYAAAAMPLALACLGAVVTVMVVGLLSDLLVMRRIRNPSPLLITLVSIGLATLFLVLTLRAITRSWLAGLAGGLMLPVIPYVLHWSALVRIDSFALALSMAGLFCVAQFPKSRFAGVLAAILIAAAVFTRQTYLLAAPLAAFFWLWGSGERYRRAGSLVRIAAVLRGQPRANRSALPVPRANTRRSLLHFPGRNHHLAQPLRPNTQ